MNLLNLKTLILASDGAQYFNQGMDLLSKGVIAIGSLIAVFGLVTLGVNLKDQNGPGISSGAMMMVGGAIIGLAGLWLKNIQM